MSRSRLGRRARNCLREGPESGQYGMQGRDQEIAREIARGRVCRVCMVCRAGTKRLLARDRERSGLSGLYGMHSRDQEIARERLREVGSVGLYGMHSRECSHARSAREQRKGLGL